MSVRLSVYVTGRTYAGSVRDHGIGEPTESWTNLHMPRFITFTVVKYSQNDQIRICDARGKDGREQKGIEGLSWSVGGEKKPLARPRSGWEDIHQ